MMSLVTMRMPYGRHQGWLLIDLPEPYVVWFARHGFPEGELGDALRLLYEVKLNGLEYLFQPLRVKKPPY